MWFALFQEEATSFGGQHAASVSQPDDLVRGLQAAITSVCEQ